MDSSEQLQKLIDAKRPFSTAEARALGISASMVAYFAKAGKVERISHGLYAPLDTEINPYPDIEQLVKKKSEFVVCLLSALRIHEFTTQLPNSLWIAIPHGSRLPVLQNGTISCVRLSPQPYNYGITEMELYGMKVKVYSAAKTVADCFKFRNKIGLDVALEAMHDGWHLKKFTVNELMAAAKVCRIEKVITPYMESLLAHE